MLEEFKKELSINETVYEILKHDQVTVDPQCFKENNLHILNKKTLSDDMEYQISILSFLLGINQKEKYSVSDIL